MIEGFLHPALAAGAALAAVPLVIHLLNRQRYRPTPWAAMRFVLAAHKRTRRRVQLENLLLLMLRMGAVALLALAVARPFVSGGGALGVLTERRREVVLVLDGSASTGLQVGAESTFATLRARAMELAEKLDGSAGDRLHVLLMGATTRLVSWPTPEKAALVLPTLTSPTDERADLAAALVEALDIVREGGSEEEQSSGAEVRVLSDLQADLFLDEEGGTRQGVLDALDAFEALGVTVVLEDATGGVLRPDNTAVSGISLPPGPLRAGEPTEILVQLRHLASGPRVAARVTLEIDGNRLPSQRVDLDPEGRAEARFPHTFTEAGPHSLVATVDGDGLAADDTRASVLVVPDPIRVLVVNGSPAERLLDDEAGFLVLALRAPEADGLPSDFEVEEVTASALAAGEVELKGRDVIWLAGVPPLPEGVCLDLEARVAAGAGLVISCGDGMSDLEGVGARLFRADGSGLLPAEPIARTRSPRPGRRRAQPAAGDAPLPRRPGVAVDDLHRPLLDPPAPARPRDDPPRRRVGPGRGPTRAGAARRSARPCAAPRGGGVPPRPDARASGRHPARDLWRARAHESRWVSAPRTGASRPRPRRPVSGRARGRADGALRRGPAPGGVRTAALLPRGARGPARRPARGRPRVRGGGRRPGHRRTPGRALARGRVGLPGFPRG
jgi:hypothetical protein